MPIRVWAMARPWHGLVLALTGLYLLTFAASLVKHRRRPTVRRRASGAGRSRHIEALFGRFRRPIRDGRIRAMLHCALTVFLINIVGDLLVYTRASLLVVPGVARLSTTAWQQGAALAAARASSRLSLLLFAGMVLLESLSYILASIAGMCVGLSILVPEMQGVSSRWSAFRLSCLDAGGLYGVNAVVLAVQAVWEIGYVRKVLCRGGCGIPLRPY